MVFNFYTMVNKLGIIEILFDIFRIGYRRVYIVGLKIYSLFVEKGDNVNELFYSHKKLYQLVENQNDKKGLIVIKDMVFY